MINGLVSDSLGVAGGDHHGSIRVQPIDRLFLAVFTAAVMRGQGIRPHGDTAAQGGCIAARNIASLVAQPFDTVIGQDLNRPILLRVRFQQTLGLGGSRDLGHCTDKGDRG